MLLTESKMLNQKHLKVGVRAIFDYLFVLIVVVFLFCFVLLTVFCCFVMFFKGTMQYIYWFRA